MSEPREGHWLIVGQTKSGKSLLAKRLSVLYREMGITSVVLDPQRSTDWAEGTVQFHKSPEFFAYIMDPRKCQQCAIFTDDMGLSVDKYNQHFQNITTVSRHHGHTAHLLCQRAVQIDVTTRDQCENLALFNVSKVDAKEHAQGFNDDALRAAYLLPRLCYLMKTRFRPVERLRVEIPKAK